jgi:hypothetical protein
MKINRQKRLLETQGRQNRACRLLKALGFKIENRRGLSPRSETFSGFVSVCDKTGREWHVV